MTKTIPYRKLLDVNTIAGLPIEQKLNLAGDLLVSISGAIMMDEGTLEEVIKECKRNKFEAERLNKQVERLINEKEELTVELERCTEDHGLIRD